MRIHISSWRPEAAAMGRRGLPPRAWVLLPCALLPGLARAVCLFDPDEDGTVIIRRTETQIERWGFHDCSSLVTLEIPSTVTLIGEGAFASCSNLKNIVWPASGLLTIDNYAFYATGVTDITLPDTVSYVGDAAFKGCGFLHSFAMPAHLSVANFGSQAFGGTSALDLPSNIPAQDWAMFNCDGYDNIVIPSAITAIREEAFLSCSTVQTITIHENVTAVGAYAFANCGALHTIELPSKITTIEESLFEECESLTSIVIPHGVTAIHKSAFHNTFRLVSVTLSDSLTKIGDKAFKGCESLTSISMPWGLLEIGKKGFQGCTSLELVHVPATCTSIGDKAFLYTNGYEYYQLPPPPPPRLPPLPVRPPVRPPPALPAPPLSPSPPSRPLGSPAPSMSPPPPPPPPPSMSPPPPPMRQPLRPSPLPSEANFTATTIDAVSNEPDALTTEPGEGEIVGFAIGVAIFLLILVAVVFYLLRVRRNRKYDEAVASSANLTAVQRNIGCISAPPCSPGLTSAPSPRLRKIRFSDEARETTTYPTAQATPTKPVRAAGQAQAMLEIDPPANEARPVSPNQRSPTEAEQAVAALLEEEAQDDEARLAAAEQGIESIKQAMAERMRALSPPPASGESSAGGEVVFPPEYFPPEPTRIGISVGGANALSRATRARQMRILAQAEVATTPAEPEATQQQEVVATSNTPPTIDSHLHRAPPKQDEEEETQQEENTDRERRVSKDDEDDEDEMKI